MREVIIEQYDPNWILKFQNEKENILELCNKLILEIEHIGSTSVENLGAKPIIDIMIGVKTLALDIQIIPKIESLGYIYVKKYENIIPFRRFFTKDKNTLREFHIHLVEKDTDFWKKHLVFRDKLRKSSEIMNSYYNLKLELAEKFRTDTSKYTDAKADFINGVIES